MDINNKKQWNYIIFMFVIYLIKQKKKMEQVNILKWDIKER